MSHNRRQFSRIQFQTEARVYIESGEFPVEILDLSLQGALFRPLVAASIPTGSNAILQLRLDELGPMIRLNGAISHAKEGHYGLACYEIDIDSITHLRRLIELNLGDSSLLDREFHNLLAS
jgi:hypothetical protein